jgi:hypothetical protein
MKPLSSFFDLDLQQKVNPYLAMVLVAAMLSWIVVYYLFNYSKSIINSYPALIDGNAPISNSVGASH